MGDVGGRMLVRAVGAHELLMRCVPVVHVGKQSLGIEETEGQHEDEGDEATEQGRDQWGLRWSYLLGSYRSAPAWASDWPTPSGARTRLGYLFWSDGMSKDLSHATRAYKRALWVVVLLNAGYGIIEMVGGLLSGSQALQADALDFLGDGLITLLGLTAIAWGSRWRARSALLQGLFLGALGLGVLANTTYRVFSHSAPEADVMGLLGAIALAVNLAAAAVLVPHRRGDSNVRAVWLFSRNDALGNIAVVLAAVFVAWTGSPWPDLAVAVVIAGLFLHSAWAIVQHAMADLRALRVGLP